MYPIYSLGDTINSFFESQSTVTRRQCDDLAASLVGEPVNTAPIQGAFIYTVIAGLEQSKIVQFRAQRSVLDMETLNLARAIYGRFVAACTYHGNIGQSLPLSVYVIENLPGTTYVQARCINGHSVKPSLEAQSPQFNIVVGFARYIELGATFMLD
ncbi:uncharacterized protein BP5553_09841 [Venustampulla echinocandica]|uniref:Uncharacterized protein n=1 Tax=Venustampulla echinocandica TaxID=2656787 RepID=A0A370TAV9_9HELO|nr:uncharacterized protein BP5553_09841 [Venustampulla echinocandica]RDL31052.1 hypothetical protein BP5553_09841 [Venustampulla echinocandica]